MKRAALIWAAALVIAAPPAFGAGNLAARPDRLPDLEINGKDLTLSQHEYRLETGKYYRWRVVSDGIDQYEVMAPELMRNSWIDKVVVEETTVKPMGIYSVELEDEGTVDIWFVPIRPGRFEFWIDGYENRGLAGDFVVE